MWPAVVAILKAAGVDLSALPAPTAADVGTVFRALDLTSGSFRTQTGPVPNVASLEPTTTNAVEAGYKGLLLDRLLVDVSIHYTQRRNFIAPLAVVTPNVFLSTADLTRYLTRFMPAQQAGALAAGIGGVDGNAQAPGIPLGTIGPDGSLGGPDILMTYSNFGEAKLWGGDVSFELAATPTLTLTGGYSHTSRVYFPAKRAGETDLSMNIPRNKAVFGATWRDPGDARSATLRGRYVGAFRMLNGVWSGDVESFTVVDAEAGASVPSVSAARVTLTVQNVTDKRHAEFFGAPVLGRLAMLRLQYRF
jgi:iron complex outermembrane receptor protein